jgi:flagellar assembly factor FliW
MVGRRSLRELVPPYGYGTRSVPTTFMLIDTTHFGPVEIEMDDVLVFPRGLVAFEECRHWILLCDEENPALAWLQSLSRTEVALPVVSPRRFVPEYSVHVGRGQLFPLEFSQFDQAYVLAVVSSSDGDLTLNLKAPLIVNLDRRLGRQVITTDEQPVALPLATVTPARLRKSA